MRKHLLVNAFCLILSTAGAAAQNQNGAAAVYSTTAGNISPSSVWVDASEFNHSDVCLAIQAAIASLPILNSTANGAVIDARNFSLPTSQTFLTCTVNPFAVAGAASPMILVNQGSNTSVTPGSAGGVVLLPGATISTKVPWIVPSNWSIFGQGARVTVIAPSLTFTVPSASGTISVSTGTVTVTGTDTWSSESLVGAVMLACGSSCTPSYTTATVVGIVTSQTGNTTLTLGTGAQTTLPALSNYTFAEPLLAWATTTACGTTPSCTGALQNQTFGSVIQDVGLNCVVNAGGGAPVSGCIPFWDQYGQERSQLKRVSVAGFAGVGIGIYTINAQNGGPFDDIQMTTYGVSTTNICVELGGTGVGTQPSMRGIRGLTCTAASGSGSGIGVDINTQNFSLSDAHFEDFSLGVEVGDLASARGIKLSDITGGNSLGTVVDINSNCATSSGSNCQSVTTADINVQAVYQSTATTTFKDNITSNTATEPTLGLYNLGDGSGLGAASTRPIATTSSSIKSSLNLSAFQLGGITISGVQGNAANLQLSSASSPTSSDFSVYDASGNITDSLITSFALGTASSGGCGSSVPTTGCGGIWLPMTFFPQTNLTSGVIEPSTANQVRVVQFVLPTKITFTRFTAQNTATDSGQTFNVGIYNASGSKLADSGSLSCTAVTTVTSTITAVTLQPGVYYVAYAATDTTCAMASLAASNATNLIINKNAPSTAAREGTAANSLSGGLLPATLGNITSTTTFTPGTVLIEP